MHELLYYPTRNYNPVFGFAPICAIEGTRLVERIVSTYRRERAVFAGHGTSLWREIDQRRASIDDVLLNGSARDVLAMLQAPAKGDLLYGFENTFADYVSILRADAVRQSLEACWIHDATTRLAEAVGAIRIAGPEAPHLERVVDVPALIEAIEQRHGIELAFPNPFEDEFGVETGRGTASLRAVHAVYQAFRLDALRRSAGGARVMEIGAGLGRTAYFASKLFSMPYTIYDLPLTNVAQAFFLGVLFGEENIALSGEAYDPTRHKVRILSVNHRLGPDEACDILLNVDSLTELDRNVAARYADFASRHASAFVSINHEAHAFTVADLMAERCMQPLRNPYWMRKGYVEEVWLRTRNSVFE